MPSSSLVEIEIEVGVGVEFEVGVELEVGIGVEVGVEVEIGVEVGVGGSTLALVLTTILDGWVGGFGGMETKTNLSQS